MGELNYPTGCDMTMTEALEFEELYEIFVQNYEKDWYEG